jgi:hypothetical protein
MTFWRSPCKKNACLGYRNGWTKAMGENWRTFKEHKGHRRRITRWFIAHSKKLRPSAGKKIEEQRWRLMGYEDCRSRPAARKPHSY